MASKKTSKSRQSIKDLSPRERQAKGVKGGRRELATAERLPIEATATMLARPARPGLAPSTPSRPVRA